MQPLLWSDVVSATTVMAGGLAVQLQHGSCTDMHCVGTSSNKTAHCMCSGGRTPFLCINCTSSVENPLL